MSCGSNWTHGSSFLCTQIVVAIPSFCSAVEMSGRWVGGQGCLRGQVGVCVASGHT